MRIEAFGGDGFLRGRWAPALLGALALAAIVLVGLRAPEQAGAQAQPGPLRVYVIVLDGLKPAEVGALMPNFNALRAGGTWYEQARAVFPSETLPNHVAMMTGVQPNRNGIIGNQYWHPNEFSASAYYMEEPELLEADTLTTRLENTCGAISTATVQSKTYLHGVFRGETPTPGDPNPQREADFHWTPSPIIPVSNHAPDASTMSAFRTWISSQPPDQPQFAFVNLGDIDRAGHVDEVGGSTSGMSTPGRQAAIEDTDQQLQLLVNDLQQSGAWDDTVLMFTSDHSMDWGPFQQSVGVAGALNSAGYTTDLSGEPPATPGFQGDYVHVGGGGTGAVYVEDDADIPDMAAVLDAVPGVSFVATAEPVPGLGNPTLSELGLDNPNNGDIVVFTEEHWRVGDGNPLPGNHGHAATQPSVLLLSGGHPLLRDTAASISGPTVYNPTLQLFSPPAGGPGNLSVAPTVASLFGIGQPAYGYDRPPLYEAFENYALAAHAPCQAATAEDLLYPRPGGATPMRIPLVPSYAECSEPDREHVAPLALPSCSAVRRESSLVTTSSIGRGSGSVLLRVMNGDSGTTEDEADLAITTDISDVRAASGGADYTGNLLLRLGLRITDKANPPPDGAPGTVEDTELSVPIDCVATADPQRGSTCNLATTSDSLVPGFAIEGARAVMSMPSIEVLDPGLDGSLTPSSGSCPPVCGSGDEDAFLVQGLFAP